MLDMNNILDTIEDEFEENWKLGKLIGWEENIKQLRNVNENFDNGDNIENNENNLNDNNNDIINPLFCVACNKLFNNINIFEYHKKGKSHLKNLEKIQKELSNINNNNNNCNSNIDINIVYNNNIVNDNEKNDLEFKKILHNEKILEKIREKNENMEEKVRNIAFYEFSIKKFFEILSEIFENTQNTIRKKQSRNYDEMEAEIEQEKELELKEEDDDEDEKPIYNPKNVPLGWDGKPIPYWLYKLHGLGIEYKCEICGGASYWGRRAFERHFQEWRHSYGMKCLKIPNTVHFKEVTGIEDALRCIKLK
jgi:splicing factor 3A subunit 3